MDYSRWNVPYMCLPCKGLKRPFSYLGSFLLFCFLTKVRSEILKSNSLVLLGSCQKGIYIVTHHRFHGIWRSLFLGSRHHHLLDYRVVSYAMNSIDPKIWLCHTYSQSTYPSHCILCIHVIPLTGSICPYLLNDSGGIFEATHCRKFFVCLFVFIICKHFLKTLSGSFYFYSIFKYGKKKKRLWITFFVPKLFLLFSVFILCVCVCGGGSSQGQWNIEK